MYRRILLSVDLHEEASWREALPRAVELCRAFGAELHLLTIFPDIPVGMHMLNLPADTEHKLAEAASDGLRTFTESHVPQDVATHQHVETGRIYEAILRMADRLDADLIVMASHRPDMSDYLIGPNAARVVRHSMRSVLVVR